MKLLGLSFFHANAAAAIFQEGQLVAAAEEERFNRVKHSAGIPLASIAYCLEQAGLQFRDIDVITYARSTNTRIVNKDQLHYQDRIYRVDSLYDRYRMNLKLINFKEILAHHFEVPVESLVFKLQEEDHHLSHMLTGFHYSPFDQALIVSCDAFGDFVSLKTGVGRGQRIEIIDEVAFPHSLGLFYSMVSQFLGFPGYGDESKVMGLSTFGYPEFTDRLRTILPAQDGKLSLNLKYFDTERGVDTSWAEKTPDIGQLFNENLTHLIGPQRSPEDPLTGRHHNLAASLQHLTEEVLFRIIERLQEQHNIGKLVLAGGLAYNSLLNGQLRHQTDIEALYVPAAPGNSGLAIGSVLAYLGNATQRQRLDHSFWGPAYDSSQIEAVLSARGLDFEKVADPISKATELLVEDNTIGWFHGRMEFGPRSLGNRSILVSPRKPNLQRIKKRDILKPFGISILAEEASNYIQQAQSSPFMSFMGEIKGRQRHHFESVLLNNYCRYQTVGEENPELRQLLEGFRKGTGLPFLINTSLNAEGEPIVASPEHLIDSLPELHLDYALLEDLLIAGNPQR